MADPDAIVVGSGPNGLAAAVALAAAGLSVTVLEGAPAIGGGTRTSELTVPGLLHDHCSAAHPLAAASPFFRDLDLREEGLHWLHAPIAVAHPLQDGPAGLVHRDLGRTARELERDAGAWQAVFGPMSEGFDQLNKQLMRPLTTWPHDPAALAGFALRAAQPATVLARTAWRTERARALFTGVAAHAMGPLHAPGSAAVGLVLLAAAHSHGWPVAQGGSRAVTDALARRLRRLGGTVETDRWVQSLSELPSTSLVLLDTTPRAAVRICGDLMPARVARAYTRWRHGMAAFKVDLAVEDGIPWSDQSCRNAGTVHLGGTWKEIAHAEYEVARGRMPQRPFVLVGQQYIADPSRAAGSLKPVWTYAHVPHGWRGDATDVILRQIERFAPGTRDRIVATVSHSTTELEATNPNYVGGDILTGAASPRQALVRPRLTRDPCFTGVPGVFLCSAATPPGPGVHGMSGWNAAQAALRHRAAGQGRTTRKAL